MNTPVCRPAAVVLAAVMAMSLSTGAFDAETGQTCCGDPSWPYCDAAPVMFSFTDVPNTHTFCGSCLVRRPGHRGRLLQRNVWRYCHNEPRPGRWLQGLDSLCI